MLASESSNSWLHYFHFFSAIQKGNNHSKRMKLPLVSNSNKWECLLSINQSQHAITQDSTQFKHWLQAITKNKDGSTNPIAILIHGASCNPIIHKKEMIRAIIVMVLNYWLWLSIITICTNLKKRKSYLYEIGESVQNGQGSFDLAIRMVSDSYSVRWNFAIPIWNRTVGCEYSNKRNLFSRIVPVT